jgi:7,8-dihydropterin-6-yl-methyl-4-(beta-D-ribofuranosyl)aminobenzene 5'-phosphate synthase
MTVSILTDNNPGANFPAEHGLSYLLDYDGKRLLFDTGQSDMFLRNAAAMNIRVNNIDLVILSHGHYDHGDGLWNLPGGKLLCHPGCFIKRYSQRNRHYIGLNKTKDELAGKFELITSSEPYKISDKIFFLGEIPRISDFESKKTSFVLEDGTPDYVKDDSAVAIVLPEGLFIVTGCSHSGIVNILEHAKKVTGIQNLFGVMGGFHLQNIDYQSNETVGYMKANKLTHILPSHCTDLPALSLFYENFGNRLVRTGDILKF